MNYPCIFIDCKREENEKVHKIPCSCHKLSQYVHGFTTVTNFLANVTGILHWQMFWVTDMNTVGNTAKHVHVKVGM